MLEQGTSCISVTVESDHTCQAGERYSNTAPVSNFLEDGYTLLEEWACGGIVTLLEGQLSCETECIGDSLPGA